MSATSGSKARVPEFPPGSSAIVTSSLADRTLLSELQGVVGYYFSRSAEYYAAMDAQEYRRLVAEAQDEINRRQLTRRLAEDRRVALARILQTDSIMIQTNLYLRATRPNASEKQESVGWHRESFYGPDMAASINFWMPIQNVSVENSLRFVPDSHLIPDELIRTVQEDDESVERFSAGHRIGLLYSPKRIVDGVDFTRQQPFVTIPGEVAIFAGALVHGAAANYSQNVRFSTDFRLIAEENLKASKTHFASGKQYFERL